MFLVVSKIILIARFCILSTCGDNLLGSWLILNLVEQSTVCQRLHYHYHIIWG